MNRHSDPPSSAAGQAPRLTRAEATLLAVAAIAVISCGLLWWSNQLWWNAYTTHLPAADSLNQARQAATQAYLLYGKYQAGDTTVSSQDISSQLDRAMLAAQDGASGHSTLANIPASPPTDKVLLKQFGRYTAMLDRFAKLTREGLSGGGDLKTLRTLQRNTFYEAEQTAQEINARLAADLTEGVRWQQWLQAVALGLWIGFLGVLALLLYRTGRQEALFFKQLARERYALAESERRFRGLVENSMVGVYLIQDGRLAYGNPRLESFFGYEPGTLAGTPISELTHPDDLELVREKLRQRENGSILHLHYSFRAQRRDGSHFPAEVYGSRIDYEGRPAVIGSMLDATERYEAETRIRHLNRVYAVLSGINEAIVRLRDPDILYREACRIAVELGGFRMAWLGMRDEAEDCIKPVAHAGVTDGYLEQMTIPISLPSAHKTGPTALAFLSGQRATCNDIEHDESFAPWRADALALGYRSSAAFPIRVAGSIRGTFNLYADTPGYFDEEELRLLDELALDLGFALEAMENETRRQQAEETLAGSELKYRTLVEQLPNKIFHKDQDSVYISCNEHYARDLGISAESIAGRTDYDFHPHELAEKYRADDRRIMESGQAETIEEDYLENGMLRTVLTTKAPTRDAAGRVTGIIGIFFDATERKQNLLLQEVRNTVLDRIVGNEPLANVLQEIAVRLEAIYPEMYVSILLLDPVTGLLTNGTAPSLPQFYNDAVEGLVPAVGNGSCGTSAYLGEPVIVEDMRTHPYWTQYLEIADRAGLRACWSHPFKDDAGRVLGTFGIYYTMPRAPRPGELALITEFAALTSLAVQQVRANEDRQQAAMVFENIRDGVVITDAQPRILAVNRAYTEITGYTKEEALGQNPNFIQSHRHDEAYFQAMWANLNETGYWQGELWNRRKNGEVYPQWQTISTVRNEQGQPVQYVGVFTDISQLKQSEARLERLAHYDPLTGLPNRLLIHSRLDHALEQAERDRSRIALLFIDLDNFKTVNDSLGHPVGDQLLTAVASRLDDRLRGNDTLGRLGGDEFLVVLEHMRNPAEASLVAQGLLDCLSTPFTLDDGHELYIHASIGISLFPDDGRDVNDLIRNADAAMYRAKSQGRNTYGFYTEDLTLAASQRLTLETRLRQALEQNEFSVYYQPLIAVADQQLLGAEALVRWLPPGGEPVPPDRFISVAEETGLIVPLGEWVLRTACAQAKAWLDSGAPLKTLAVNLSVRQLRHKSMVAMLTRVIAETGLPAERLELEITEGSLVEQGEQTLETLHAIRGLGVRLAVDDFGTGYSSLGYLKRLPIDKLKIDRSFVRDLPADANDMAIASTIIAMARTLNLEVLAEGVETEDQLDFLREQGCNACQGYLFSPPVPSEAFVRFFLPRPDKGT